MDDEPLILEIQIVNDTAGVRYLQNMVKAAAAIQPPIDSAAASVQKLNHELHTMASQWPKGGGTGSIAMPSIASPHGMPSLPSGGAGDLLGGIGKAGSMISDLGKMAGVAEMGLMEFTGPLAVAVDGVELMAKAASEAAESLTHFKESMITSGGNAGEVGRLNSLGGAVGINDMAGLSRQLADRLASNGQAAAFGQNAGIHDYGGAFSDLDKAKNLLKGIDYIQSRPHTQAGDMEAARFARVEGLEAALKVRDLSQQTYANLNAAGNLNAMSHGPEATKSALEYDAAMSRLGTEFDMMKTNIGSEFLPSLTAGISLVADLAHGFNWLYGEVKPVIDILTGGSILGMKAFVDWVKKEVGGSDDKQSTERDHTDAMREHAQALRSGTYGGGNRARNAMPHSWGGSNADSAYGWDRQARQLGAL